VNQQISTDALRELQFLEAPSQDVLERIAEIAFLRTYAPGEYLFREGASNQYLLIIAHGRVALEVHVPTRSDVRILSLGRGDMIAWSALLGDGRMTTSAVALENTEAVAICAAGVLALCQANPEFGYYFMRQVADALANRLVATRLQLLDLFGDATTVAHTMNQA
jgi:CRP/FNR family transcriptional regulator, cyclic AMP receptor protein